MEICNQLMKMISHNGHRFNDTKVILERDLSPVLWRIHYRGVSIWLQ